MDAKDGFLNIMLCLYLFVLTLENSYKEVSFDIFQNFLANVYAKNRKRLFAYLYIMGDIWDSLGLVESGYSQPITSLCLKIKEQIIDECKSKNIDIVKEVKKFIQSEKRV